MAHDVVVVGSVNHDLTVSTPHHPAPGETVLGRGHRSGPGGKGANQAVAAARLGAATAFVGRVGADDHGRELRAELVSAGVDVTWLSTDSSLPTGLALITVDDDGENAIVVSPGANRTLTPAHVEEAGETISASRIVLSQLEVPIATVLAAAKLTEGLFVLNPAPAQELPSELLQRVDILIPNRAELADVAGTQAPLKLDRVAAAAAGIDGPRAVVVTLGSQGALLVEGGEVAHVPAHEVEPVDTTGAGDAFCGALASALARGEELIEGIRWASKAAAISVTRTGAQPSMPTTRDMESHGRF